MAGKPDAERPENLPEWKDPAPFFGAKGLFDPLIPFPLTLLFIGGRRLFSVTQNKRNTLMCFELSIL